MYVVRVDFIEKIISQIQLISDSPQYFRVLSQSRGLELGEVHIISILVQIKHMHARNAHN